MSHEIPLAAASTPAGGQQEVRLAHFRHDSFSQEQGAPANINAIAQSADGYLWLGARDGLFRFDGVSFERIEAPANSPFAGAGVMSLMISSRGELWVGFYGHAGVAIYRNGHLVDTKLPDPPPQVTNLAEGPEGTIWAQWGGVSKRLWRWRAGRWSLVDGEMGLPPGYALTMLRRTDGSMWLPVITNDQRSADLVTLPVNAHRFVLQGGGFQYPALGEDPHGHLWIADRREIRMVYGAGQSRSPFGARYPAARDTRLPHFAFDQWGGLWETTEGAGVLRVAAAEKISSNPFRQIERYRAIDGLSSDYSQNVLVDREGTVWIGTENGLDRFRFSNVRMETGVPSSPVDGIRMEPTLDGAVHVLAKSTLYDIAPGQPARRRMRVTNVKAFCGARDNSLWLADAAWISRLVGTTQKERYRLPQIPVAECAEDALGRLWLLTDDRTVWWKDAHGWHRVGQGGNLLIGGTGLSVNAASEVAFDLGHDMVGLVDNGRLRRIDLAKFRMGAIRSIDPVGQGFLLSMDNGIVRIRNGKAQSLSAKRFPWLTKLLSSVETTRGDTWFYNGASVSLVRTADLDRAFDDPRLSLARRLFDPHDGLSVTGQHFGFGGPQALASGDGRLWLATGAGLQSIDPSQLQSRFPLSVAIRSVAFGNTLVPDPTDIILPAGTSSVRILYSALNLAAPDRAQFRFKLNGVDADWVDPGTRRATTYTNLSPGDYDFKVFAVDENGAWSKQGATLHFVIQPTFFQSWPFKLLCALLIAVLLWFAYRLRMTSVAANVRARMAERDNERERIARELHDTLLQSIHGLILHVQAATITLRADEPARTALECALDRAQDAVEEGRDRVQALRVRPVADDLQDMLKDMARMQLARTPIVHIVRTIGKTRPLCPVVADEIMRVAHEAFFNVTYHAGATEVGVELVYGRRNLTIFFRDNGIGASEAVIETGFKAGHFGLVGMRERAGKMGGELTLKNRPEGGFEVKLMIPASVAYAREASALSRVRALGRSLFRSRLWTADLNRPSRG